MGHQLCSRHAMSGLARAEIAARSALVGNPSDAFGGATIAFTIPGLSTTVEAEPADEVMLEAHGTQLRFADAAELVAAGRAGRYPPGGELALLMAAAKRWSEWYAGQAQGLNEVAFRLAVADSTIPPRVGLAGSSAVVVGALRALGDAHGARIEGPRLPRFALACEAEELGITAGLQDRVVQSRGGLVFMDFDDTHPAGGEYTQLSERLLPPLVIAWLRDAGSDSGATHTDVRERFERGDREVIDAMEEIAWLARAAREALENDDQAALGGLMVRNLAIRKQIYTLDPRHEELVETAAGLGLPANYTGSGGAIVALRRDVAEDDLRDAFAALGAEVLVVPPG
jgi:glucuronokinase